MLFKQTLGHEYYWAAVAQESCCERHSEAEKMREEGLESVGPGHRDREDGWGKLLRKQRIVQICGRRRLCCLLSLSSACSAFPLFKPGPGVEEEAQSHLS